MTHKSQIIFPNLAKRETKSINNDKKHVSTTNISNNSFHRHSRLLPTLAQSFSSSESQIDHNLDFGSKLKYLDSYKNLKKIKEVRMHHLQPQTPISSYLSKLEDYHLAPVPMGLIKKQGVCEKLDTSNMSMGDHYAEAMAAGLENLKVRKIIMKNNGLSDKAASKIIENLDPRYSTEINFSENHIAHESILSIGKLNTNPFSKLQVLNLESNNLGDKNISMLCNSLIISDRIRELVLSNNKISHEGAFALSNYISNTTHLLKIDLSWNNIRGEGGNLVINALTENESVIVVDLSWNTLSSPVSKNCSKALSDLFKKNLKIIHIDISQNMLSKADCNLLNKGLHENFTILGLHVEGNYADVDVKGNLVIREEIDPLTSLNQSRMILKSKALKLKNKNCWICQRWNEFEFKWRNGKSGPYGEEPFMVHLDFEKYIGCELREQQDSWFTITRMCPPGPITFFFTLRGMYVTSSEYKVIQQVIEFEDRKYSNANLIEVHPSPSQLWLELRPKTKPRDTSFIKEEIPPWDFGRSVFRDYISDSYELINDCYHEDMQRSKIRELTTKEYDSIFEYLRQYYTYIKETYKLLASKAWLDWDVWLEILIEFVGQNNIFNQNDLRPYDIESIVKTFRYWNSTTEIYFARYQFLELIVRICIMKYYRNRKVNKISQAVKLFFKNHLSAFDKNSSNDFRVEKLYNQAIDRILYKHQSILIKLYYYFAQENNFSMNDFARLMQSITKDYGLIQIAFILAKETSPTYSYFSDSLKFVEFLEALVRIIDMVRLSTNQYAKLEILVDETIEVKLIPLLSTIGSLIY